MQYIKMTMAQALVKFLDNQYINFDGQEIKFIEGIFTIFGHGNVIGLGQALDENKGNLKVFQGRNEQGMAHTAISFAKQNNRKKIIACTSSIGPGACNMVTAAATATVNNIPLLLFPADTFSTRQPDPVLQQIEQANSLSITSNDAFKPVCKYWDRVTRPEQIMSAMINAMRVLTDAENTGAVCVSLCQNVEGEAYEYPETFFEKRVYNIDRRIPTKREINDAKDIIKNSKKPLIIVGGGARYSEAGKEIEEFCEKFNIPFAETQAGKSTCKSSNQYCLGGIGVTGNLAANNIAQEADLIISIGSRLSDFTTGSKSQFKNKNVKFININVSKFHAFKLDAMPIIADAKETIIELKKVLEEINYKSGYLNEIKDAKLKWTKELEKLSNYEYDENFRPIVEARNKSSIEEFNKITNSVITQTKAISKIREIIDNDAIIVGASGSLPGCLQRMWQTDCINSYNMEYGYSCMGYEIAGSLGAKLACENQEVYAMVGDGSFQMLHSELVTAIQENAKINILLFDNCGFGCINNLQMSNGIGNLATEFRYRENNELEGNLIPIDYAKIGEGYGLKTYIATTIEELEKALKDAKNETNSTLIDIKVLPKTMTNGYNSWWNIGLASVSKNENVKKCYKELEENRFNARRY